MFKIGDKVICIDDSNLDHLNKSNMLNCCDIYVVTLCTKVGIKINNRNCIYGEKRFVLLKEQRKNKLNKLNKLNNYEYNM